MDTSYKVIVKRSANRYIRHADDEEREDHKYVARVKTKNPKYKWRYFYSMDAYNAYLKSKEAKKDKVVSTELASDKKTKSGVLSKVSSFIDNLSKNEKTVEKKTVEESKKETPTVKEALSKIVKKGEKLLNKSVAEKGKDIADKVLNKNGNKTIEESKLALFIPASLVQNVVSKAVNGISKLVDKVVDKFSKKKDDSPDDKKNNTNPEDSPIADKDDSKLTVTLKNGKKMRFKSKDEYDDYLERCQYQSEEPDFMKDIPDIPYDTAYTKFEDQEKVNEEYSPYDKKTSTNCANCSAAYELRRRGYDVEAVTNGGEDSYNGMLSRVYDYFEDAEIIGIDSDGSTLTLDEKFTKNACEKGVFRAQDPDSYDFLFEQNRTYTASAIEKGILENSPPGSRGFIDVAWKDGGAHSIVYEVDNNGKITIRDSQLYDEYDLTELAHQVSRVTITRTDNLELKEDILSAVQTNDDDKRKYYVDGDFVYYY